MNSIYINTKFKYLINYILIINIKIILYASNLYIYKYTLIQMQEKIIQNSHWMHNNIILIDRILKLYIYIYIYS